MRESVARTNVDQLVVEVYPDAGAMGHAAARRLAEALRSAVATKGRARLVAATGNSQFPLIANLAGEDIPWSRVTVFHMDEYIGIDADHPASFRRWIHEQIEAPYSPERVEYLVGDAPDIDAEIDRYEAALRARPIDAVCMGIGENGHLAFNEPGAADFDDVRWVRRIELLATSRTQQVNEGHFPTVADVPASAISLTIPALLSAETVIVCAPEARKAAAVRDCLEGPVTVECPASILRRTPHATLMLDKESSLGLRPGRAG